MSRVITNNDTAAAYAASRRLLLTAWIRPGMGKLGCGIHEERANYCCFMRWRVVLPLGDRRMTIAKGDSDDVYWAKNKPTGLH